MANTEHVPLAQIRLLADRACRTARDVTLNETTFLGSFPTPAVAVHKDMLEKLRQQVEELMALEMNLKFDVWSKENDIPGLLQRLDRAHLDMYAAAGFESEGNAPAALTHIMTPAEIAAQARVLAKEAEVARLEEIVPNKENTVERLRQEVEALNRKCELVNQSNSEKLDRALSALRVLATK